MRLLLARIVIASFPIGAALACGTSTTTPPAVDVDAALGADVDASDEGTDAATDTRDSGAECVLSRKFGSQLCEKCLRVRCCAPIVACESDPACKTVLDCSDVCLLSSSNVAECIDRCLRETPAGAAKYKAFDGCFAASPKASPPGCAFDCSQ